MLQMTALVHKGMVGMLDALGVEVCTSTLQKINHSLRTPKKVSTDEERDCQRLFETCKYFACGPDGVVRPSVRTLTCAVKLNVSPPMSAVTGVAGTKSSHQQLSVSARQLRRTSSLHADASVRCNRRQSLMNVVVIRLPSAKFCDHNPVVASNTDLLGGGLLCI